MYRSNYFSLDADTCTLDMMRYQCLINKHFESVSDRYLITVWDRWIPNIEPCIKILVMLCCLLQYLIYHLIFLSNNNNNSNKNSHYCDFMKEHCQVSDMAFYIPVCLLLLCTYTFWGNGNTKPYYLFSMITINGTEWRLWCKRDTATVSTSMHSSILFDPSWSHGCFRDMMEYVIAVVGKAIGGVASVHWFYPLPFIVTKAIKPQLATQVTILHVVTP